MEVLIKECENELIPAAVASPKGQCVIWEGAASPLGEQTALCSKHLTCQMPGLGHFGEVLDRG